MPTRTPLEPPECFQVRAALGWLELGNINEAISELESLPSTMREHPEVLEAWWLLRVQEQDWQAALDIAKDEARVGEDSPNAWLHQAYALRRLPGSGLLAAWDALRPAVERFPEEPVIPFNLACYACQLGRLDEAREWFAVARQRGGTARMVALALSDPDLEPLWPELRAAAQA